MGRGRKARTAAPTVVGATPATEDQPFVISMQQRQSAQDAAGDMDTAGRTRQPAKLKPTSFFTVPPRTEVLEKDDDGGEKDMFKRRADAPANLGEISGMIWAKASTRHGGAKDLAAGAAARVGHVMEEMAHLDEGGDAAVLKSVEGFKAFADEGIWGVRAPEEVEDAPLDVEDVIQVKDRLKLVWAMWRKLTPQQQRAWAAKQLSREGYKALARAAGVKAAGPRPHGSLWAAESAAARTGATRNSRKKPDGWTFSRAPNHTDRNGKLPALEPQALRDEQLRNAPEAAAPGDSSSRMQDAGTSTDQGPQRKQSHKQGQQDADDVGAQVEQQLVEDQWRRAAAVRHSRLALMAQMDVWETEAEEQEAAAAAGITVAELRRQRKQEAADAADRREQAREEEDAAEQEGNEEEAAAPPQTAAAVRNGATQQARRNAAGRRDKAHSKAMDANDDQTVTAPTGPAGKKQLKRKASTGTAGAARSAGCVKTSRAAGKGAAVARKPSRRTDPYEMDLDDGSQSDDEDAPGPEEEAELARALSDGDDSDADASSQAPSEDGEDEEEEEEEEEEQKGAAPEKVEVKPSKRKPVPATRRPQAALAAAAAALAKRSAGAGAAAAAAPSQPPNNPAPSPGMPAAAAAGAARSKKAHPAANTAAAPRRAVAGSKRSCGAAVEAVTFKTTAETAAADGRLKRRKQAQPTSTALAGPAAAAAAAPYQQQSPVRRSTRHTYAHAGECQDDDEDGPAVSGAAAVGGAGRSTARAGRPTPAGTAQAAQIEQQEMQLFSNTRRSSFINGCRADSPGVGALPSSAQDGGQGRQGSSRLARKRAGN